MDELFSKLFGPDFCEYEYTKPSKKCILSPGQITYDEIECCTNVRADEEPVKNSGCGSDEGNSYTAVVSGDTDNKAAIIPLADNVTDAVKDSGCCRNESGIYSTAIEADTDVEDTTCLYHNEGNVSIIGNTADATTDNVNGCSKSEAVICIIDDEVASDTDKSSDHGETDAICSINSGGMRKLTLADFQNGN